MKKENEQAHERKEHEKKDVKAETQMGDCYTELTKLTFSAQLRRLETGEGQRRGVS